ncbi:GNAT family N-acetyltransferase [Streptomyces sp. VRA16 Mangrove soil]|uniref:GNAT family N-acetyltransferase n=1 Tax=Streptomyces sp. VRA16 Mangrove soil TaxID=2817434 RepID=UPI001AA00600|nr:GNAT family N-acetyltransferase [Streptomyces sp. VRA16 Mangrove soil]MBO1337780.1 GNAT family N-acetyltransferase [Streptomyces sp. VRA16 Mangrove soil]
MRHTHDTHDTHQVPLHFDLDPSVTPALRDGALALWADVSNAGGAVGFVPPVTPDDIRPELVKHFARMAEGGTRLLVGRTEDGAVAATAFLTYNPHRLMKHHLWLYTVMVHPAHQGKGYGRALMAAAQEAARGFDGIEALRLTCRGGTGADTFYAACGYKEVGRVPGAIRVAPGDDRDDIHMMLPL